MSDPAFITASALRAYLELNTVSSSSKYDDSTLGSNIRAASGFLQRRTARQFADQSATKKFTTHGRTSITIPGLRAVSGVDPVTVQSTALTADTTYWLLPDVQQSGVYTGIAFRAFGSRSYLSNPEWFDRNLDRLWDRYGGYYSLPNDLSITGSWGYTDANLPEELLHATKILAAWYTLRPDSVLANISVTAEGTVRDYSNLPPEIGAFLSNWTLSVDQAVSLG